MKVLYTILILLAVIFACHKKDSTPQGDDEVWLLYKRFNPTLKDVKKGTTITFKNKDNANHTVTEIHSIFASGKIKSGDQYQFTFSDTGTYSIYCNFHPDNLQEQIYITVKN